MSELAGDKLRQVSWLIHQRDFARIERLLNGERERTGNTRISQGDIARAVVARGTEALCRERNIAFDASKETGSERVA